MSDPLTITSAALIALGLLVDLACKLTGHPTVSSRFHKLERAVPWTRAIVALLTLTLFTHLTFAVP